MDNFPPLSFAFVEHTICLAVATHALFSFLKADKKKLWKKIFTSTVDLFAIFVPAVSGVLASEKNKALADIEKDMLGDGDEDANITIPSSGLSTSQVLSKAEALKNTHEGFASGKKWGGIYHQPGSEITTLQSKMWGLFNSTNSLYPGVFPSIRKFEAELISMVSSMVQGKCGLLTSGGTESILIAVLAYRQHYAKAKKITSPEIICCVTAHPAIHKACKYFGVTLVKAPFDPKTFQLTPSIAKRYITRNTIAIYASAPTFPHGVLDDVEGLATLATQRKIGLHVDNCLGGFLLSYLQKEKLMNRKFDFSVPGVTTMSVDLHKYGGSNKGVSVCVFASDKLRSASYMPSFDGCEGLYVTPTLQGSRSGATMAASWASVLHRGDDGYRKMARDHYETMEKAKRIVEEIDGLELLVQPEGAILPIVTSPSHPKLNIYTISSQLEKRGWNMFTGQSPPVLGLCVGDVHLKILDEWGKDLKASVSHVIANPDEKPTGNAAVYGSASTIPDTLLDDILREYVDISLKVKAK